MRPVLLLLILLAAVAVGCAVEEDPAVPTAPSASTEVPPTEAVGEDTDPTPGGDAPTVVTGTRVPPPPARGIDPAIGTTVPVVEGFTPDDEPVTLGAQGQAQAVVFLAHWCPHCQAELPLIADWVEEGLLPAEVQLVAVSTAEDPSRPNWPADQWLEDEGFPGKVLVDSGATAAEAWGLGGVPMWTFVDDTGTIVQRHAGPISAAQFERGPALASSD